jgi:hypothetical protein
MSATIVHETAAYRLLSGATMIPDRPGRRPALVMHARHPETGKFGYVRLFTALDVDPLTEIETVEVIGGIPPRCVIGYRGGKVETLDLPETYNITQVTA